VEANLKSITGPQIINCLIRRNLSERTLRLLWRLSASRARNKIGRYGNKTCRGKLPGGFTNRVRQSLIVMDHDDGSMFSFAVWFR
jgi:hypothetical protein